MQSAPVPGAQQVAGEGIPRRHIHYKDKLTTVPESVNSLYDSFLAGYKRSDGKADFLGRRAISPSGQIGPYTWETYKQAKEHFTNVGSALVHLGIQETGCVGLFSVNRPEWVIGEYASYMYNFTTVPLYDTLGKEAIQYIINQTDMSIVLATTDKAKSLLAMRDSFPSLRYIVTMEQEGEGDDGALDSLKETLASTASKSPSSSSTEENSSSSDSPTPPTIQIFTMRELEALGKEHAAPARPSKLEDIATICYTSGTTGLPKGVVLTHRNLLTEVHSFLALGSSGHCFNLSPNDVHISYLPLAHVMERVVSSIIITNGARIGFFRGDTAKLLDDIVDLRPTVFISVPRLFNRIYDKVLAGVKAKGGISAFLFNYAYSTKKSGLARGTNYHWLWDRLVFGAIRAKLGGRVRYVITGSAPIAPDVLDFLRIVLSADVLEGYGQTECVAGLSLTMIGDMKSGHVGPPFPGGEVKLVDIPSMSYTSADKPHPRGEVCVRGGHVFREYWKDPAKTAETLDSDGWCHTGDVGSWDDQGRLVIIDRVKNIFKLAQGEYIAPDKIEGVYGKHELVEQIFVHGDSLQSALVGIIVPDASALSTLASSLSPTKGSSSPDLPQLCQDPKVVKAVLQALTTYGKANDLKGFEQVRAIRLIPEPFTVDSGLLTPTFKLKRHEAKAYFLKEIDEMYAQLA
ncbi:MAG: hypothetical protein DHS80DRAFT_15894 [Piptocephalis tieghemiana]|nr:MAG: hypothetical protein DHS80DRAFT_15894 [Piptocephalis tieghemiana]